MLEEVEDILVELVEVVKLWVVEVDWEVLLVENDELVLLDVVETEVELEVLNDVVLNEVEVL